MKIKPRCFWLYASLPPPQTIQPHGLWNTRSRWRLSTIRLRHLISCLFSVLSREALLKSLVTPYLLTPGQPCGHVCPVPGGSGEPVLQFQTMASFSLKTWCKWAFLHFRPQVCLSDTEWGSFLCVTVTQEPFIFLWSKALQTSQLALQAWRGWCYRQFSEMPSPPCPCLASQPKGTFIFTTDVNVSKSCVSFFFF